MDGPRREVFDGVGCKAIAPAVRDPFAVLPQGTPLRVRCWSGVGDVVTRGRHAVCRAQAGGAGD